MPSVSRPSSSETTNGRRRLQPIMAQRRPQLTQTPHEHKSPVQHVIFDKSYMHTTTRHRDKLRRTCLENILTTCLDEHLNIMAKYGELFFQPPVLRPPCADPTFEKKKRRQTCPALPRKNCHDLRHHRGLEVPKECNKCKLINVLDLNMLTMPSHKYHTMLWIKRCPFPLASDQWLC